MWSTNVGNSDVTIVQTNVNVDQRFLIVWNNRNRPFAQFYPFASIDAKSAIALDGDRNFVMFLSVLYFRVQLYPSSSTSLYILP